MARPATVNNLASGRSLGAQRGGEKQKWLHELGQLGDRCEQAKWPQSLVR
jgi:hypothetical protein